MNKKTIEEAIIYIYSKKYGVYEDLIESDCDSFVFITLTNNEIYLIGVDKEPFLNQQKGVTQEFKSLY